MDETLQELFNQAMKAHANDIYFLPQAQNYLLKIATVRGYRKLMELPSTKAQQLISYLKYQANMSLSEHRRPQLGSWIYHTKTKQVFCRLSSVGDFWNRESLVIRLIYPQKTLSDSYFFDEQIAQIQAACQKRGLIIFSGPVSSAKSTVMYQCASLQEDKQVLCIEDPIEIYEPQFLQLQVNEKAQMTYGELLKVSLRHHPDIFIIGEIRDEITAKAAIDAALSGHLVLTTLHAQGVYGVMQRLMNLQVSEAEILQTVRLISYQRLLPTVSGDLKVLFDLLDQKQLSNATKQAIQGENMSERWRVNLAKCQKEGWIDQATYQKFQDG